MLNYKAQLTLNGAFPQNDVLPESCQFSCPWKARNPLTGEWHCTIYDVVSECSGHGLATKNVEVAEEDAAKFFDGKDSVCAMCEKLFPKQPCEHCPVTSIANAVANCCPEGDNLPEELVVSLTTLKKYEPTLDTTDKEELSDVISDWLSDEYGYCHDGFNLEWVDAESNTAKVSNIRWDTSE